jgi:hypothetical protein
VLLEEAVGLVRDDDDAPEVKEEARFEDDIEPKCRGEPLRGIPLVTCPWPVAEEGPVRACEGDENILEKALRAFDRIEDRKPSLLCPTVPSKPARSEAVGVEPMPEPRPYEMCRAGVVCCCCWLVCALAGASVRPFGVEGERPSFSQSSVDRSDSTPPEDERTSEPSAAVNRDETGGEMAAPAFGGVRGRSSPDGGGPPNVNVGAGRGVDLVDELSWDDSAGDVLVGSALACGIRGRGGQRHCAELDGPLGRTKEAKSRLDLVLGMSPEPTAGTLLGCPLLPELVRLSAGTSDGRLPKSGVG